MPIPDGQYLTRYSVGSREEGEREREKEAQAQLDFSTKSYATVSCLSFRRFKISKLNSKIPLSDIN
jgi:hypothetical protein